MVKIKGGEYGGNAEDAIQVYQEDGWTTVAHMNVPRYRHAISVVPFDEVC